MKIRQPIAAPIPEIVKVEGEEMPISMEAVMLALAAKLKLPGYGKDGFASGVDFYRPEDFYLKAIANVALGDKPGDEVPEASAEEVQVFRQARRHLPRAVFDEKKWVNAVGQNNWRRTVYVLNRGGRFEDFKKLYEGEYLGHPFAKLWNLYVEPVALAKDSITGQNFHGVPRYEPIRHSTGKIVDDRDYPFALITYKEIFGGHSRTIGNYWTNIALQPENFVLMNKSDAGRFGLRDGDEVKLVSRTNLEGILDLGNGQNQIIKGKIKTIQGIRPGVIAVSWHFGHWAYGARDVIVDGKVVKGDPRRSRGLCANPVLLLDEGMKTTGLTDPIGGSASFYDTKVKLIRI
jgi:anaerobic selenocysteine-containing dehydrogenase